VGTAGCKAPLSGECASAGSVRPLPNPEEGFLTVMGIRIGSSSIVASSGVPLVGGFPFAFDIYGRTRKTGWC
jgi:hypothetical protein